MIKIKLVLTLEKHTSYNIIKEVSEDIIWDELEYIFAQTDKFQDFGLYYHGAKLWHLVDQLNYDNNSLIDKNEIVKNTSLNKNLLLYLVWEEEEAPDSP